jgi:hypothetical protein
VWIDETGGTTDATDAAAGQDGTMEITVDGQTYTGDENMDLSHDGVNDTVRLDNEDGTVTAYVDTDGDGQADQYLHTDTEGNIVETARFDESTGDWVDAGTGTDDPTATDADAGRTGEITVDMQDGTVQVGPATVDSNEDGTADTAVVTDEQGNTRLFTDVDGDGSADVQTIITPEGESTTYEHTGPGEWTESATANGVSADSDQLWGGFGSDTVVEGVAKIDSVTGQWISQN